MKELTTTRLRLRKITLADAPAVAGYMDDPSLGEFIPGIPYPYTLSHAEEWIKKVHKKVARKEALEWAIEYEQEMIGALNVHDIDLDDQRCNVGYLLSGAFHRRGFMSEALSRVLDYAFDELGVVRVGAEVFSQNTPSRRLLEKQGFLHEGTLRSYSLRNGTRYDNEVYGLLVNEWK